MSADTASDDLDPSAFVRRIRELSERHEREDAERLSSIEADIEKGRSERAARRAERARSLSPDKTLSPSLPSPRPLDTADKTAMEALSPSSRRTGAPSSTLDQVVGGAEPEPESARPESPSKSASSLARSGTLSWQQRPQSGSIRRPLSVASRASVVSDKPAEETAEPSRNQIAQALGSKDPSWFKQTADRGIGNAAIRRNQEEPEADAVRKFGLPGMSRPEPSASSTSSAGGATSPPPDSLRSSSPSRTSAAWSNRISTATSNSTYSTTEPKASQSVLDPPKLSPSSTDPVGQARPASPTRGAGGFVQSAMMKRSDSVSKRWSAQAGSAGLQRQNSTARAGISGSNSMPRLDQTSSSLSRDGSTEPSSRPSSSYSNHTVTQSPHATDDGFTRPPLPSHTRSKSTMSLSSAYDGEDGAERPPSPSKRWSPTKSSWLESAINRPESPRATSPTKSQPSWMAELNKSKQQKASGSIPASPALEKSLPPAQSEPKNLRRTETSTSSKLDEPADSEVKPQDLPEQAAPVKPLKPAKPAGSFSSATVAPESSPKTDFRANLKPREPPKDPSDKKEPEFRNALGKLRKAETKNYVAPDTFTDNIKAGKAALTLTGGVPTRVRRDELKETLVAQKEAMKAKKEADPDLPTSGVAIAPPKEKPVPEFLAARQRMGNKPLVAEKSKAATDAANSPPGSRVTSATRPKADAAHERTPSGLRETGLAKANEGPQLSYSTPSHSRSPSKTTPVASPAGTPSALRAGVSSKLAERFNPGLANMLARGPPPASGSKGSASSSMEDSGSPSLSRVTSAEPSDSGLLEHKTKARARGPKRRAPAAKNAEVADQPKPSDIKPAIAQKPAATHFRKVSLVKPELVLGSNAPVPDLTDDEHGTDTEAARPRAKQGPAASPPLEQLPNASAVGAFDFGFGDAQNDPTDHSREAEQEGASTPRRPYASLNKGGMASFANQIASKASGTALPAFPAASSKPSAILPTVDRTPGRSQISQTKPDPAPIAIAARSPSPAKQQSRPASPEKPELGSGPSVRNAAALWGRTTDSAASSPKTGPSSPIKLPSRRDEEDANRSAGLASAFASPARINGLGLESSRTVDTQAAASGVQAPQQQIKYPMSPPPSAGAGLSSPKVRTQSPAMNTTSASPASNRKGIKRSRPPSIMLKPPPESPGSQTSEASQLLSDFFGSRPVMPQSIDVDTQALITDYTVDTSKVKTTSKQVCEIASDGKTMTLPTNEEHTLFEGSMYAIAHSFERSAGGKVSEAYLWVGNEVSQSAAEDVQVFAKRFAKDNKAVLEVVQQGKESSAFIQALGGILITRRGARSQRNSTQNFMLCGRGHLGTVAFDEVDFSLRSFSSGFPFLVFAAGKLHLWKGAGSTIEEVSCARLIAMDIGVTPDVTEVVEGQEPASFISLFPAPEKGPKKIFPTADHWQRKAHCERYRTRLFHVTTTPLQQQQQQGGFQTPTFGKTASLGAAAADANPNVRVQELAPYTQRDMEGKAGVFVLDAFFELYIILTPHSRSSPDAFTAALLFAQDYGILATSLEDRPLLPVSTVVVDGAPRDMKSCFKKWEDSRWTSGAGSVTLSTGGAADMKRGKSLRVVGLDAAIAAAMGR